MFSTTPYICCYTTLGNVNVQIIQFFWIKALTKTYSVIDEAIAEWRKLRAFE